MKETTVKISVTQDGLLPEEVAVLGTIFLPSIQRQLLKSLGFEKISEATFTGVIPMKIVANQKTQVIEFEVGSISKHRKKVIKFVNEISLYDFEDTKPEIEEGSTREKVRKSKQKKNKEEKIKDRVKVTRKSRLVKKIKEPLKKVGNKKAKLKKIFIKL